MEFISFFLFIPSFFSTLKIYGQLIKENVLDQTPKSEQVYQIIKQIISNRSNALEIKKFELIQIFVSEYPTLIDYQNQKGRHFLKPFAIVKKNSQNFAQIHVIIRRKYNQFKSKNSHLIQKSLERKMLLQKDLQSSQQPKNLNFSDKNNNQIEGIAILQDFQVPQSKTIQTSDNSSSVKNQLDQISNYYVLPNQITHVNIHDYLEVNCSSINFGTVFPGYIIEKEIEIRNKSDEHLLVYLNISPNSNQLQSLDDFVYSMRPENIEGYGQRQRVLIAAKTKIVFKIALNTPYIQLTNSKMEGVLQINLFKFNYSLIQIPLLTRVVNPEIKCRNQLIDYETNTNAIQIILKQRQQEFLISFQNPNPLPFCADIEIVSKRGVDPLSLVVSPSHQSIGVQPNSNFQIQLTISENGVNQMNKFEEENTRISKKIILFQMKNTFNVFSFPIIIEKIYED